jgi:streptogramin lyase
VQPALPCAAATRDTPAARFDRPLGVVAAPDGSIYVADQNNHVVRRLAPKEVINRDLNLPGADRPGQDLKDFTDASNRTIYRIYTVAGVRLRPGVKSPNDFGGFVAGDSGSADALPARSTAMRYPSGVTLGPDGTLYILDQGNLRVLMVPNPGSLNAVAYRVAGAYNGNSGDPRSTQVMNPRHVLASPDGSLWVADSDRSVVRRISPDGAFADVVAGTGNRGGAFDPDSTLPPTQTNLVWPTGTAVGPDGSVYIADRGAHKIFRIQGNTITRFAGTGRADFLLPSGYSAEGRPATEDPLYSPAAVAVGPDGSVYIADTFNSRIRKVDPSGRMFTLAGTGSYGYNGDGKSGPSTSLFQPEDVTVGPDGAVYFADTGNAVIRKIDPVSGVVAIVAGTGGRGGFGGDGGPATAAQLNGPGGLSFGPDGSLYVADTGNNRVRRVSGGTITTVAGTGSAGEAGDGGDATKATLNGPRSVSVDAQGTLYIADTSNNRVRVVAGGAFAPASTAVTAAQR